MATGRLLRIRSKPIFYVLAALLTAWAVLSVTRDASAQEVPAVDFSTISPDDFADDELDIPYYLAHFHTLANSVVMSGPDRGFIDLSVWRLPEYNEPYNARVMENILSLAYFYATDRPWNPYFGHPSVRDRLEAAFNFWVNMQSDDGRFATYAPREWRLSPTSFATKFMGETLQLLSDGPPVDSELLDRVVAAQREAILAVLTRKDFYDFGRRFTNQYTNVWGGALAYLDLYPDPEIRALLIDRLQQTDTDFQSPAGYFYEHDGADWTYDIQTHHSNHALPWHYLREDELRSFYAQRVRRWYDWLAYNAALEPDGSGFTLNYSLATRSHFPFYRDDRETPHGDTCSPLAEVIHVARAFCETVEEREARLRKRRRELERSWPDVRPLEVGAFSSYSPYAFLHRNHGKWHPTEQQRDEAIELLPYRRARQFNHQRADNRHSFTATYLNRARYYAAFTSGEKIQQQQRFGLGLILLQGEGAVLQNQLEGSAWGNEERDRTEPGLAWGTRPTELAEVYETSIPDARFEVNGSEISPSSQAQTLRSAPVTVAYSLGDRGQKLLTFLDDEIVVEVQHDGRFVETLPFLLPSDASIEMGNAVAAIDLGESVIEVKFDADAEAVSTKTDRSIGRKRVHALRLRDRSRLTYRIRFLP